MESGTRSRERSCAAATRGEMRYRDRKEEEGFIHLMRARAERCVFLNQERLAALTYETRREAVLAFRDLVPCSPNPAQNLAGKLYGIGILPEQHFLLFSGQLRDMPLDSVEHIRFNSPKLSPTRSGIPDDCFSS